MKNTSNLRLAGALALLAVLTLTCPAPSYAAGIPEPGLTLYGRVLNHFNGATTRLTTGNLTWTFKPLNGGAWVTVTTPLTNINDQFSFVLQVPCESEIAGLALSTNTLKVPTAPAQIDRTTVLVNGQLATVLGPAQGTFTLAANERARFEQVDLQVGIAPIDTDGDGLPDDWEMAHFGSLAHNGSGDADGDGVSNLAEYQAGTDPNDPKSRFAFIHIGPHPQGGVEVQWASAADHSYVLQRSSDLLSGYTTIASGQAATPPVNTYHDATAIGAGPFFYRIQLSP